MSPDFPVVCHSVVVIQYMAGYHFRVRMNDTTICLYVITNQILPTMALNTYPSNLQKLIIAMYLQDDPVLATY